MHRQTKLTATAAAPIFAALLALASPTRAETARCDSAAGREIIAALLKEAGEDRPVNITIRTRAEGVNMPDWLRAQYPDEIPVILQYQFDRLVVRDARFDVTLYFKGRPARLSFPLDAVKTLYDDTTVRCSGD